MPQEPSAISGEQSDPVDVEKSEANIGKPSAAQLAYLKEGLDQAGGKLPLFDKNGQAINSRTIKSCISQGWAEPWFANPTKPDWLVCRLTEAGRQAASS